VRWKRTDWIFVSFGAGEVLKKTPSGILHLFHSPCKHEVNESFSAVRSYHKAAGRLAYMTLGSPEGSTLTVDDLRRLATSSRFPARLMCRPWPRSHGLGIWFAPIASRKAAWNWTGPRPSRWRCVARHGLRPTLHPEGIEVQNRPAYTRSHCVDWWISARFKSPSQQKPEPPSTFSRG